MNLSGQPLHGNINNRERVNRSNNSEKVTTIRSFSNFEGVLLDMRTEIWFALIGKREYIMQAGHAPGLAENTKPLSAPLMCR